MDRYNRILWLGPLGIGLTALIAVLMIAAHVMH